VQVHSREAPPAALFGGHVADHQLLGGDPGPAEFEFGCASQGVHQGDVWAQEPQSDDILRRRLGSPKWTRVEPVELFAVLGLAEDHLREPVDGLRVARSSGRAVAAPWATLQKWARVATGSSIDRSGQRA